MINVQESNENLEFLTYKSANHHRKINLLLNFHLFMMESIMIHCKCFLSL